MHDFEDPRRGRDAGRPNGLAWASDADLAWRSHLLGWRCVYELAAVARLMQFRNRYLTIARNKGRELGWDLPLVLGYAPLRERRLLRAYADTGRRLPARPHRRRAIQSRRAAGRVRYGLQA